MKVIKNIILKRNGKEKLGTKFFTNSDIMITHLQEKYETAGYVVKSYKNRYTNDSVLELYDIPITRIARL